MTSKNQDKFKDKFKDKFSVLTCHLSLVTSFNNSTFRGFDEADEFFRLCGIFEFGADRLDGLRGVELGGEQ